MRLHCRRLSSVVLVATLAACAPIQSDTETAASIEPSVPPVASPSPSEQAEAFPIEAFADISDDPVSRKVAAELQAILDDMADGAGISATVMSADGTWSGATGKADGVRDVTDDDQFAIASITKSLVAAQVMQMVEEGELGLDDLGVQQSERKCCMTKAELETLDERSRKSSTDPMHDPW